MPNCDRGCSEVCARIAQLKYQHELTNRFEGIFSIKIITRLALPYIFLSSDEWMLLYTTYSGLILYFETLANYFMIDHVMNLNSC